MSKGEKPAKRNPPINIPLDFDMAVEGLLAVDPKEPEKAADEDYEKAQGKKKRKKKR